MDAKGRRVKERYNVRMRRVSNNKSEILLRSALDQGLDCCCSLQTSNRGSGRLFVRVSAGDSDPKSGPLTCVGSKVSVEALWFAYAMALQFRPPFRWKLKRHDVP